MRYTTRIVGIPRTARIPYATMAGGVRKPQVLGPQRSFGFGDRLGLATPGHAAAALRQRGFMPVFAQQSVEETVFTGVTWPDVMAAAARGLAKAHYRLPWGADADRLKTSADVERAAAAGFTYFTLDPSDYINEDADLLSADGLSQALAEVVAEGDAPPEWTRGYLDSPIEFDGRRFEFNRDKLARLTVKFGRALARIERLAAAVARGCGEREHEIEVAINAMRSPTAPLDHLYLGLELEARRIRIVSFAPRLVGAFETGADFEGDATEFEAHLRAHAAIAAFCGPYKLSVHGIADKWSVLPLIGVCCGDLLHVKMGEGSYLEALRVVWRANPVLFEQIARFCEMRFEIDRAAHPVSTTPSEARALFDAPPGDEEHRYLDERAGRQLLAVTYGAVLSIGKDDAGRSFKEGILETLEANPEMYSELVAGYFTRHMALIAGTTA